MLFRARARGGGALPVEGAFSAPLLAEITALAPPFEAVPTVGVAPVHGVPRRALVDPADVVVPLSLDRLQLVEGEVEGVQRGAGLFGLMSTFQGIP